MLPDSIADALSWKFLLASGVIATFPCLASGVVSWHLVRGRRRPLLRTAVVSACLVWCALAVEDWRAMQREYARATASHPGVGGDLIGIGIVNFIRYPLWLVVMFPAFTTTVVTGVAIGVAIVAPAKPRAETGAPTLVHALSWLIAAPGLGLFLFLVFLRIYALYGP